MEHNFEISMKLIAGSEGGYSNHPSDPGGHTMKGVTLANYRRYCARKKRPKPNVAELKAITDAEVSEIFRIDYWNRVRGDVLPAGVDFITADFAFNSGPGQAAKELQRVVLALGHDPFGIDGQIGNGTMSALDAAMREDGEDKVINAYMDKRLAFMQALKHWNSFKNGWTNRIRDVRLNGLKLAHGDPTYMPVPVEGGNAKADPAETKMSAMSGGTSTITTIGGAVATAATAGATQLVSKATDGPIEYLPWLLGGFILLTIVGSIITAVVLNNRTNDEGVV